VDRARQEIALLREELRIKDARMASIPPRRRPHYPPKERLAILELKAALHAMCAILKLRRLVDHSLEHFLVGLGGFLALVASVTHPHLSWLKGDSGITPIS
jgi:hypothetical protein